jgi:hypothetical protein
MQNMNEALTLKSRIRVDEKNVILLSGLKWSTKLTRDGRVATRLLVQQPGEERTKIIQVYLARLVYMAELYRHTHGLPDTYVLVKEDLEQLWMEYGYYNSLAPRLVHVNNDLLDCTVDNISTEKDLKAAEREVRASQSGLQSGSHQATRARTQTRATYTVNLSTTAPNGVAGAPGAGSTPPREETVLVEPSPDMDQMLLELYNSVKDEPPLPPVIK